jgi:D-alanyl-D-alanine carboxypeptidase
VANDPKRVWETADLLELAPSGHLPAGEVFVYSDTNYLLLGLAIEQIRERPLAEVLRDGVLDIEGVERLIYQPDEYPTEPMAMPNGGSTAALKQGGGYLPSVAGSTSDGPGAAMASDAPSLARWWRAFCAGEIVSQDSLIEMATFDEDDYGLGLFDIVDPGPPSVGHAGAHIGYVSWAGCLPDSGAVIVVLHNRVVDDIGEMAQPLVAALSD